MTEVMIYAFEPVAASTVQINVSASNQRVQLGNNSGISHKRNRTIRVFNEGSATVWIEFGIDNTIAAAVATGMPVPAGAVEVFTGISANYVAAIAAGATGKVYFTAGDGT
jgi:hypothetical protein